jgi:hypothetical protein
VWRFCYKLLGMRYNIWMYNGAVFEVKKETLVKGVPPMKSMKLIVLALVAITGISAQAKDVPKDVQQSLISLDKQWGEAGADTAKAGQDYRRQPTGGWFQGRSARQKGADCRQ